MIFCGCQSVSDSTHTASVPTQTFLLDRISPEQAQSLLSQLNLGEMTSRTEPNSLLVTATPPALSQIGTLVDVIDANEPYVVEHLAPASAVRTLPSNSEIAQAVGSIAIGTFTEPPATGWRARAIIDVAGEAVIAIVPQRLWLDIRAVVERRGQTFKLASDEALSEPNRPFPATAALEPPTAPLESSSVAVLQETSNVPAGLALETAAAAPSASVHAADTDEPKVEPPSQDTALADVSTQADPLVASVASEATAVQQPESDAPIARGILRPSARPAPSPVVAPAPPAMALADGNDVLEISLPERIELGQLIDLVGEYLHLDCIYDAERIGNQTVTLKLHSDMQSEIRVKDLYSLLETILKFKGLAMTRREGNLVSIVPAAEVLDVDPELVHPADRTIQAGDMVVIRIFELQHVDVASVTSLLQNMRLGMAVSSIPETQTLFVTCYAQRMARIEELVGMIDKPGPAREFRFRQMRYTLAQALAQKVLTLAEELEDIAITIAPSASASSGPGARANRQAQSSTATRSAGRQAVYLDTDERTNRLLMIGTAEQLETIESLIDTLDVPQQDVRTLGVYTIRHVPVETAVTKLAQLDVIASPGAAGARASRGNETAEASPGEEPQVVLLEATNSLLINATAEQHAQIRTVISYIDVAPHDPRSLRIYAIHFVEAEEVLQKLEALGAAGQAAPASGAGSRRTGEQGAGEPASGATAPALVGAPQIVIQEITNSLLITATDEQHDRLAALIPYLDVQTRRERIPYEIYFLENQDPERMATLLRSLVQQTVVDPEGKVEDIVQKTDEDITIIADDGTFALIVYANRKNQEWIAELIQRLDQRRPQVLIDVTLVEISKTEAFTYDLNLIQSLPDLTATSGLVGTLVPGSAAVTSADIMTRLDAAGRSQFADYQANGGDFRGFYGDRHINLLLEAMQSKNYGRVLAQPNILVNDNQPGTIKATDTTYVTKRSSIPVSSGGAGTETTLIETAVDYQPYEAGITLNITPHISQGDLLRLDIALTRSDFRETEDDEKPPNTTASELNTTVFVPDGSTIILGGLIRLNQNKGGGKVPILGDLPLLGGLFRSVNNRDTQNKLYVFVKAQIIRPASFTARGASNLEVLSDRSRAAFEQHEAEFQAYQNWPGVDPKPVEPRNVLEAR